MIREIYVRNIDKAEGLELNLPLTKLELSDAFELLETNDKGRYQIGYGQECGLPDYCYCKDCSLEELNCLAIYLERMDDIQFEVFDEIVQSRESFKTFCPSVKELINFASRAMNCRTIEGIRNDRELGEYLCKTIPKEFQEIIDPSKLGANWRKMTQGVYTRRGFSYPDNKEPYQGEELPEKPEKFVFQIELRSEEGNCSKINLPAEEKTIEDCRRKLKVEDLKEAKVIKFTSVIPHIYGRKQCDIQVLNELAQAIEQMPDVKTRREFHDQLLKENCFEFEGALETAKRYQPPELGQHEQPDQCQGFSPSL